MGSGRRAPRAAIGAIMAPVLAELVAEVERLDARLVAIYGALPFGHRPSLKLLNGRAPHEVFERDASISWPMAQWREALLTDPSAPAPDLSAPAPLAEAAE
jgi:hypothetical protein